MGSKHKNRHRVSREKRLKHDREKGDVSREMNKLNGSSLLAVSESSVL